VDKFVKFPTGTAEIAGVVVIVLATMIVAARTPVIKKWV
jgi:hypothetical protein